jgi:hypothetical protein
MTSGLPHQRQERSRHGRSRRRRAPPPPRERRGRASHGGSRRRPLPHREGTKKGWMSRCQRSCFACLEEKGTGRAGMSRGRELPVWRPLEPPPATTPTYSVTGLPYVKVVVLTLSSGPRVLAAWGSTWFKQRCQSTLGKLHCAPPQAWSYAVPQLRRRSTQRLGSGPRSHGGYHPPQSRPPLPCRA